jgi:hypothetical protein
MDKSKHFFRWVIVFLLAALSIGTAHAGTGGYGRRNIHQQINYYINVSDSFNNLVSGTANYQVFCHGASGCSAPSGSIGESTNININGNGLSYEYYSANGYSESNWNSAVSFQSIVDNEAAYYTQLFEETGAPPTTDELITALNNAAGYNGNTSILNDLTSWAENTASGAGRDWWNNTGGGACGCSWSGASQFESSSTSSISGSEGLGNTEFIASSKGVSLSGHKTTGSTISKSLTGSIGMSGTATTYSIDYQQAVSPLVLNMNGSGKLEASGGNWLPHPDHFYTKRLVLFDLLGDGFPMVMEWVGPHDGLLVHLNSSEIHQLHSTGTVQITGQNLFGTMGGWVNGYQKLSLYDTTRSGKLTGHELKGFYVWQDKNGNGKVDPGELKSVQQLGITQIDVIPNAKLVSHFIMKGKQYKIWDWYPNALEVLKRKP